MGLIPGFLPDQLHDLGQVTHLCFLVRVLGSEAGAVCLAASGRLQGQSLPRV